MIEKAIEEKKIIKEKLKNHQNRLHEIERLLPFNLLLEYFKIQKCIITLEKEKEQINEAIKHFKGEK